MRLFTYAIDTNEAEMLRRIFARRALQSRDSDGIGLRGREAQFFWFPMLIGVVPAVRLLETGEFDENGIDGFSVAIDDLERATDREITPAELLDDLGDVLSVFRQLVLVAYLLVGQERWRDSQVSG